jgi:hypothetical protein
MNMTKADIIKRLEDILTFLNQAHDQDYLTLKNENMIIAFDYTLTEFRQVLDKMKEVDND